MIDQDNIEGGLCIMVRVILLIALATSCVPGCGREPEKTDPEKAGPALLVALAAWKDGKSPEDLEKQDPSIVMNEASWHSGDRLLDFKMEGASTTQGRHVFWEVQITVEAKTGGKREAKAQYMIDATAHAVHITRRDLMNVE